MFGTLITYVYLRATLLNTEFGLGVSKLLHDFQPPGQAG